MAFDEPSSTPTPLETDIHILRANALKTLAHSYEGLIVMFDMPLEKMQRVTTYPSRKVLVNNFMTGISATGDYAAKIGLLSVDDVKSLYEKYLAMRPDVFAEA